MQGGQYPFSHVRYNRLQRSDQMMRLEQQELSREARVQVLRELVDEIVDESPKALWEDR